MSVPQLHPALADAYTGKLNAALGDGDSARVAELTDAYAQETGGAPAGPAPRRRRLLRALDQHTLRVFNPPSAHHGGWADRPGPA